MSNINGWKDRFGQIYLIQDMSEFHIKSIIKCMNGEGKSNIPDLYNGTPHSKWIEIFKRELEKRENRIIENFEFC